MRPIHNQRHLPFLLLLLCLFLTACQTESRGQGTSAPAPTKASTEESIPRTEPSQEPSEEPEPAPPALYKGRVYTCGSYGYLPKKSHTYLDEEGNILDPATVPKKILDRQSGKTLYYCLETEEGYSLYSREGQWLDSAGGEYEGAVGPLVFRHQEKKTGLFGYYYDDSELINPLSGEVFYRGGSAYMTLLTENRAVLHSYGAVDRIEGVFDASGKLLDIIPQEYKEVEMIIDPPFIIIEAPEGKRLVLDENFQIIDESDYRSTYKRVMYFQSQERGAFLVKCGWNHCDILFPQEKKEIRIPGDSLILQREIFDQYVESNGWLFWNDTQIYTIEGDFLARYDAISYRMSQDQMILARTGDTLYLLDERGGVVREKKMPGLIMAEYLSGADHCFCCLLNRRDEGGGSESFFLILGEDLEPIGGELWTRPRVDGAVILLTDNETGTITILNRQGEVIMEDARAVGTADEYAIGVAKGMFAGLIDLNGNWIRKHSIYEFPEFTYWDD